jgi:elongation factor G
MSDFRNVGLFAHTGAGKTSLADAMLYSAKENTRLGKVADGTSLMDFEPEEIRRKLTLTSAFNNLTWKKCSVNIVDTPGESNFFTDSTFAMKAIDCAIIVVDAVDGMKIQSERAIELAEKENIPVVLIINKLDKERADFEKAIADIKSSILKIIPVVMPIGKEAGFTGIIDLISMKSLSYKNDESGDYTESEIPANLKQAADSARNQMVESIAELDEKLTDKYLESGKLSEEEISSGLRKGLISNQIIPVLCSSAIKNIGVKNLLDFIVNFMPDPTFKPEIKAKDPQGNEKTIKATPDSSFSAFVFKTIADPFAGKLNVARIISGKIDNSSTALNVQTKSQERFNTILQLKGNKQKGLAAAQAGDIVAFAKLKDTRTGDTLCFEKDQVIFDVPSVHKGMISFALKPKSKGDEDKITMALARMKDEDPALTIGRDQQTNALLITGLGQLHIEVTVEKMKRKYGVEVIMETPKIPYKETIRAKAQSQGKYKRQSGGRGQYGDTWLELAPLPRGKGFEFVDKIVGGVIPKNYIPSVEKGVVEAMLSGSLAGFPVVDMRVTLYDGSYHEVDSSDMAFKIAASMGFKKAMLSAKPVLLEPIMNLEIIVPDQNMGDVIGDLNSRRGKVLGMDQKASYQIIKAQAPMAEVLKYSPDLRSITQGRGTFTVDFSHYEEVPPFIAEKIIAENKKVVQEENE